MDDMSNKEMLGIAGLFVGVFIIGLLVFSYISVVF